MSSTAFGRIATNYASLGETVSKLRNYLSKQDLTRHLRVESIADFVGTQPEVLSPILDDLASEGVLVKSSFSVCPACDVLLEHEDVTDGSVECDLCGDSFRVDRLDNEECYRLTGPVLATSETTSVRKNAAESNPLANPENLGRVTIQPWNDLREADYTLSLTTLDGATRDKALALVQKLGIVRLRWQGDPPSAARLLSLENWIGPARTEQNDYVGKVKSLRPQYDVEPNTGDSSKALPLHVDGTQDERTPALIAFQYDYSSTWGGESTFIDMAALLAALPYHDLETLLVSLARSGCAQCTKTKGEWSKTFEGPLVRAEDGGTAVSIRFRPDSPLSVKPETQEAFDKLKGYISAWEQRGNVLTYTPHEGDVVLFDNWRLLHGRTAIGGRHQRIHDRMWMDSLLPKYRGQYALGIRGLGNGLMHLIEQANL